MVKKRLSHLPYRLSGNRVTYTFNNSLFFSLEAIERIGPNGRFDNKIIQLVYDIFTLLLNWQNHCCSEEKTTSLLISCEYDKSNMRKCY